MAEHSVERVSVDRKVVLLRVEELCKRYDVAPVLDSVSFEAAAGEVTAILGPSGAGKTTLGEILVGIVKPDSGRISIGDRDITHLPPHRRGIALAPQEWELFPHLTALENVAFGAWATGVSRQARLRDAASWLEAVGLLNKAQALPAHLSGGQQQRVALVRALAAPGSFVVLDEPFANVDQAARDMLRAAVLTAKESGRGVLLITHDQKDALTLADRLVCLSNGRVIQSGPPRQVYMQPESLSVARVTGSASLVPLQDFVVLPSCVRRSFEVRPVEEVCGAILRPEWLEAADDHSAHLEGTVTRVRYEGEHYRILVELNSSQVEVYSKTPMALGSSLQLMIRRGLAPPLVELSRAGAGGMPPLVDEAEEPLDVLGSVSGARNFGSRLKSGGSPS
jgi:ABC-type Fe3+/spermidine/putrescine transport system ATPase subunit